MPAGCEIQPLPLSPFAKLAMIAEPSWSDSTVVSAGRASIWRSCVFGFRCMAAGAVLVGLTCLLLDVQVCRQASSALPREITGIFNSHWEGQISSQMHLTIDDQSTQVTYSHSRRLLLEPFHLRVPNQPENWTSLASLLGNVEMQYQARPNGSANAMKAIQHLGEPAARPITRFCIYGERCSGTNWVTRLLHANFILEEKPDMCPHKHDLKLTVPNEFAGLGEDTLVVSVFRNVLDWTTSFYNKPWHAQNHCNLTFAEFLTKEWSLGEYAEHPEAMPPCAKYVKGMLPYYELSHEGKHPANVLELRQWKLRRQSELCATRRQSVCLRYEDVFLHQQEWLQALARRYSLVPRPGFPSQVLGYKGWGKLWAPTSELARLVHSPEESKYFDADTVRKLVDGLDLSLERDLGYTYEAALKTFPAASALFTPMLAFGFQHVDPISELS